MSERFCDWSWMHGRRIHCKTKRTQQISISRQQKIHLLFIDLSAAFDGLVRKWMFETVRLRFRSTDNALVNILERLYTSTSLYHHSTDTTFSTTAGVRQGGSESPCLFNLFLDWVMRVFLLQAAQQQFSLAQVRYRHILQSQSTEKLPTYRRQLVPMEWLRRRH